MKSQDNRRSHKRPTAAHWLTPEQIAAAREQALKWREAWRAEVAARDTPANGHEAPRLARLAKRQAQKAAEFAHALARVEFGRFYWSEKLAHQLTASLRKEPADKKGHKVKRE